MAKRRLRPSVIGQPVTIDQKSRLIPTHGAENTQKGEFTAARSGYYGEISFIDTQIGRLMNWFRRHQPDTFADTWFIFTSDHGEMLGDHNLWRKTYAYEGSARIPFIVTPPTRGAAASRKVADEVVELRDIMPTILDAAGVDIPKTVDGQSVVSLTEQPNPNWRPYLHGEHCTCYSHEQEMQYVTDGKRKLIWLPRIDELQFFDLEEDPGECYNRIDHPEYQTEIAKMEGILDYGTGSEGLRLGSRWGVGFPAAGSPSCFAL